MTTKEKIAVMQHWLNGGKIEIATSYGWQPYELNNEPKWDWYHESYRIDRTYKYLLYEWWFRDRIGSVVIDEILKTQDTARQHFYDKSKYGKTGRYFDPNTNTFHNINKEK